jgi:hypothetical protein
VTLTLQDILSTNFETLTSKRNLDVVIHLVSPENINLLHPFRNDSWAPAEHTRLYPHAAKKRKAIWMVHADYSRGCVDSRSIEIYHSAPA